MVSRGILTVASLVCVVLFAVGVRHATFGGGFILSWLVCMLLPLPGFVLFAWVARRGLDLAAGRRAKRMAAEPQPETSPEQHLLVAAVASASQSTDVATLLTAARDSTAFFYARSSGSDLAELAAPFLQRAVRGETKASYRSTAFRDSTHAGAGTRVVVMAFETPVTHSSAAPPEDLEAMRALLGRIRAQPVAPGAVVQIVPNDPTESLTSEAVRALYPELRAVRRSVD